MKKVTKICRKTSQTHSSTKRLIFLTISLLTILQPTSGYSATQVFSQGTTNDPFLASSVSKQYMVTVSKSEVLITRKSTGAAGTPSPEYSSSGASISANPFEGIESLQPGLTEMECFNHFDICVICGTSGCFSISIETQSGGASTFFHRHFYTKYDAGYSGLVILEQTNYFLAVGVPNSDGSIKPQILRFDLFSDNCYKYGDLFPSVSWSQTLRNPYRAVKVLYTSNYLIQTPLNIQLWEYSRMTNEKVFGDFSGFKAYDLASFSNNLSKNLAVTCFADSNDVPGCKVFNYAQGTTLETYSITNPSIGVFDSGNQVAVTDWVFSSFFLAIFKHKYAYIFDYNTPTDSVHSFELGQYVFSIKSSNFYTDLLTTESLAINRIQFTNPSPSDTTQCHNMCDSAGSCNFNYDRHYCSSCGQNYSSTNLGCADLTPSETDPVTGDQVYGGIFIYPNQLDYSIENFESYDCSNTTLPTSSSTGNEQNRKGVFTVKEEREVPNYGVRAIWIILLIMAVIVVTLIVIFIKCSGKNNWAEKLGKAAFLKERKTQEHQQVDNESHRTPPENTASGNAANNKMEITAFTPKHDSSKKRSQILEDAFDNLSDSSDSIHELSNNGIKLQLMGIKEKIYKGKKSKRRFKGKKKTLGETKLKKNIEVIKKEIVEPFGMVPIKNPSKGDTPEKKINTNGKGKESIASSFKFDEDDGSLDIRTSPFKFRKQNEPVHMIESVRKSLNPDEDFNFDDINDEPEVNIKTQKTGKLNF